MKTKIFLQLTAVFLLWVSPSLGLAQTDTLSNHLGKKVMVSTVQGFEIRGTVSATSDSSMTVITEFGTVVFKASQIESIEHDEYTGAFRFPNPHDTRYFFGPSAIPIKKGKGYYQNLMVVGNFLNVGLTDWLSIGGGFEFISTVSGEPIGFLTPKVGWQVADKLHVGGGVFLGGMVSEFSFTMPYAAITYGTSESNVTLGGGSVYTNSEWMQNGMYMISATHRFSNSVALLTENYILPGLEDVNYFGIHGIRILSEKNAFDLGVIAIPGLTDGIPLPYVGYARGF